jgi:hypothetical protein
MSISDHLQFLHNSIEGIASLTESDHNRSDRRLRFFPALLL